MKEMMRKKKKKRIEGANVHDGTATFITKLLFVWLVWPGLSWLGATSRAGDRRGGSRGHSPQQCSAAPDPSHTNVTDLHGF
ncbi:hypothetical protein ElyMa_005974400 [Elysia marginata]|uniref:Uncharacterized protein n=1 Tax=Elysia marginata TaxID=1093978 RepID=A0AAV4GC99_9GAST|nr:hypothetical protein ElyMa_005974400 [Elysia marginata]